MSEIEKDFKEYFLSRKEPFESKVSKDREILLPVLNKLYEYYFLTSYISDYINKSGFVAENQERSFFTLINKAALDTLGIYSCLWNGLEVQATIIIRSLFENYINALLIFEKDDEVRDRYILYDDFQYISRWKHILQNEDLLEKGKIDSLNYSQKDRETALKDYTKVSMNYSPNGQRHWAWKIFKDKAKNPETFNPSLYNICNYLNPLGDYLRVYSPFSLSTHSQSIIGNRFTVRRDNKSVSLNSPHFTLSTAYYPVYAVNYCNPIILNVLEYVKIENYLQIEDLLKKFYIDLIKISDCYKDT